MHALSRSIMHSRRPSGEKAPRKKLRSHPSIHLIRATLSREEMHYSCIEELRISHILALTTRSHNPIISYYSSFVAPRRVWAHPVFHSIIHSFTHSLIRLLIYSFHFISFPFGPLEHLPFRPPFSSEQLQYTPQPVFYARCLFTFIPAIFLINSLTFLLFVTFPSHWVNVCSRNLYHSCNAVAVQSHSFCLGNVVFLPSSSSALCFLLLLSCADQFLFDSVIDFRESISHLYAEDMACGVFPNKIS